MRCFPAPTHLPSAARHPIRPTAKAAAPIDLTGYGVSVVTEDWRWRMLTPPKRDYISPPLNPEGRKTADTEQPAERGKKRQRPTEAERLRGFLGGLKGSRRLRVEAGAV